MSSFTFADNKLGGRLMTATDAIAAGKLRTAAGILNELAEELNVEAESTDGLMAEALVEWPVNTLDKLDPDAVRAAMEQLPPTPPILRPAQPADLQMCARNVHAYGAPDPHTGWRTCAVCGNVNVAPPDGGTVDMSARPLGDYA